MLCRLHHQRGEGCGEQTGATLLMAQVLLEPKRAHSAATSLLFLTMFSSLCIHGSALHMDKNTADGIVGGTPKMKSGHYCRIVFASCSCQTQRRHCAAMLKEKPFASLRGGSASEVTRESELVEILSLVKVQKNHHPLSAGIPFG